VQGRRYVVYLSNRDWRLSPVTARQAYVIERVHDISLTRPRRRGTLPPNSLSTEKWMLFPIPDSTASLFTFSGFAQFVWGKDPMFGTGGNDSRAEEVGGL
jgi:hypothetical protein